MSSSTSPVEGPHGDSEVAETATSTSPPKDTASTEPTQAANNETDESVSPAPDGHDGPSESTSKQSEPEHAADSAVEEEASAGASLVQPDAPQFSHHEHLDTSQPAGSASTTVATDGDEKGAAASSQHTEPSVAAAAAAAAESSTSSKTPVAVVPPVQPMDDLTHTLSTTHIGASEEAEEATAHDNPAASEAAAASSAGIGPSSSPPPEPEEKSPEAATTAATEVPSTPTASMPSVDDPPASSSLAPTKAASAALSPPLPSKKQSLPPPPLPGKAETAHEASQDEKEAVARAFGVSSTPPSAPGTPDTAAQTAPTAPSSGAHHKLASPTTPHTPSSASSSHPGKSPGIRIGKGPPPTTLPAEEAPFDFNRFLEQMKDPSARGVGEYVRSFIKGFAKKPYRTSDQIKLIFDFLDFIGARMRGCQVWANLDEGEFENAREAMEKLVMNRLYSFTFTPAVAKEGRWSPQTDDLERDRVLRERIELFGWLQEEHLDVPKGDHSRGFVDFAIQELLKINHYKAPRDKLICILNCCKVIFGLIRHLGSDENADTFVPVLIFVVLKANPEHLISNVEYIGRFRNPDKLSSESGYYLSSLMGATAFIETMDYSSLSNITQEEFEKRVEEAVQVVGKRKAAAGGVSAAVPSSGASTLAPPQHRRTVSASDPHAPLGQGEEAASHLPAGHTPPPALTFADDTKAFFQRTGEAARVGITNSLGKPIGALGKLLGEGLDGIRTPGSGGPGSSVGASPARVESPAGEKQQQIQQQQQESAPRGMWGGLFGQLDEAGGSGAPPPQTPAHAQQRQGPFSSLMRVGGGGGQPTDSAPSSGSNHPPQRRIGETPYAPPRQRPAQILTHGVQGQGGRPAASRQDSLDPFNSPDPATTTTPGMGPGKGGAAADGRFPGQRSQLQSRGARGDTYDLDEYDEDDEDGGRGGRGSIGTPSDVDTDDEDGQQRRATTRSRLPDFGAFVPSFLSQGATAPGVDQQQRQQHQYLQRGPNRGRSAFPSSSAGGPISSDPHGDDGMDTIDSSLVPVSDEPEQEQDMSALSAEVERRHREQVEASVETLKSVFPQVDDEVRRAVLEECGGDVGTAIDRLLEMQDD